MIVPRTVVRKPAVGIETQRGALRQNSAAVANIPHDLERRAKGRHVLKSSNVLLETVMIAAEKSGLLGEKTSRIGGRISPALIEQAKKQTGIEADTDLSEFALANIALEDNFAAVFKQSRGKVDPNVKLGF